MRLLIQNPKLEITTHKVWLVEKTDDFYCHSSSLLQRLESGPADKAAAEPIFYSVNQVNY